MLSQLKLEEGGFPCQDFELSLRGLILIFGLVSVGLGCNYMFLMIKSCVFFER